MRNTRARIVGAAAILPMLALSVTACSDDSDSDSDSGKPLTVEQLRTALPGQADFPEGFTFDDSDEDDEAGPDASPDVSPEDRESATDPKCQPLMDLINPDTLTEGGPGAAADVGAVRMGEENEMMPAELRAVGLWSFDGDDARKLFNAGKKALDECAKVETTDSDGEKSNWEFTKADAPDAGAASLAFTYTQVFDGETMYGSMVVVRTGNQQASFAVINLSEPAEMPPSAQVTTVVDKLKAAAG